MLTNPSPIFDKLKYLSIKSIMLSVDSVCISVRVSSELVESIARSYTQIMTLHFHDAEWGHVHEGGDVKHHHESVSEPEIEEVIEEVEIEESEESEDYSADDEVEMEEESPEEETEEEETEEEETPIPLDVEEPEEEEKKTKKVTHRRFRRAG